MSQHHRRLERMYLDAPVNARHDNLSMRVTDGSARVGATVTSRLHHAAGTVHGSYLFELLDDAAFFAAQSMNPTHFVVTTSFTSYITKVVVPAKVPTLTSTGTVTSSTKGLILAEAVLRTPDGTEVARGSGTFMPHPKLELALVPPYVDDEKFPFIEEDDPL